MQDPAEPDLNLATAGYVNGGDHRVIEVASTIARASRSNLDYRIPRPSKSQHVWQDSRGRWSGRKIRSATATPAFSGRFTRHDNHLLLIEWPDVTLRH